MEFQSTPKRHPLGARRFNPTARVRDARKLISIHQPAGDAHAHHISIHRSPLLLHHRRRVSIRCKMNHPRVQLISIRTRIRGSWRSRKTGFNPLRRPYQTWLGDGRFNPHAQYFSDSGRAVSIHAPRACLGFSPLHPREVSIPLEIYVGAIIGNWSFQSAQCWTFTFSTSR